MKKAKRLWRKKLVLAIAPSILAIIIKIYFSTCRVICIGQENENQYLRCNKPILFVSWHQGLLYYVYHFRNRNGLIMVSKSRDGELMAQILKKFGFQSVRGSSSRQGKKAMWKMIEIIKHTQCSGGLVADAPRGPFGIAKMGIVKIAKETEVPLIPVMIWAEKKILFKNWDKTMLPLPFSKIVFYYDEPILVPASADDEQMEQIRANLTDKLNEMHRKAQHYFVETTQLPAATNH